MIVKAPKLPVGVATTLWVARALQLPQLLTAGASPTDGEHKVANSVTSRRPAARKPIVRWGKVVAQLLLSRFIFGRELASSPKPCRIPFPFCAIRAP